MEVNNNRTLRIHDKGFVAFGIGSGLLDQIVPLSDDGKVAENRKRYINCNETHPDNPHQCLYLDTFMKRKVWGVLKELPGSNERIFVPNNPE